VEQKEEYGTDDAIYIKMATLCNCCYKKINS